MVQGNTRDCRPAISVVVPARNEAGNVAPLVAEIEAALNGRAFEAIFVNDGSGDTTEDELRAMMAQRPWLRLIRHVQCCGQSAATLTGVKAARAPIIVTIAGDGEDDPAFATKLVAALEAAPANVGMVAGERRGRKASAFKKLQSRVANRVRGAVLKDGARDTGCGLKAFRRELFLSLPYFDGLHRFLPALVRREGFEVSFVEVVDRPRRHGTSHYGLWNRLWIGIADLAGMWWLMRRRKRIPDCEEVTLAR
jgi:dolichol-phosphate mannosyltransferase